MLAFLLQKKRQYLFVTFDNEEMTGLLKAKTSPSSTTMERSFKAEEVRVRCLDHVDGVWGRYPSLKPLQKLQIQSQRCMWGL